MPSERFFVALLVHLLLWKTLNYASEDEALRACTRGGPKLTGKANRNLAEGPQRKYSSSPGLVSSTHHLTWMTTEGKLEDRWNIPQGGFDNI